MGQPLPSQPAPEIGRGQGALATREIFDSTAGVVFRQSLDQPLLGSFQIFDQSRTLLGFLLRDGEGFQIFRMGFALLDASRRPIYLIRPPAPRPGIHVGGAFTLQTPDGSVVGELSYRAGLGSGTFSLTFAAAAAMVAVAPYLRYQYSVVQSGRDLAQVRIDYFALPGGIHLDFSQPPGSTPPRSLIVALVSFASIFKQQRQFPTGAAPLQ